jgi:hypothetical protein
VPSSGKNEIQPLQRICYFQVNLVVITGAIGGFCLNYENLQVNDDMVTVAVH